MMPGPAVDVIRSLDGKVECSRCHVHCPLDEMFGCGILKYMLDPAIKAMTAVCIYCLPKFCDEVRALYASSGAPEETLT